MSNPFQIVTEHKRCPNEVPEGKVQIAIIGEAPGEDEETHGHPFIGASGNFLNALLRQVGVTRSACLIGNVAQQRPAGNKFALFDWNGVAVQDGIAALTVDVSRSNPTICLLLGNAALHLAKVGNVAPKKVRGDHDWPNKISGWRGSLFRSQVGPFAGRKCIAAYHPAFVLRSYKSKPLLDFDLRRLVDESRSTELHLPKRDLITNLSAAELCHLMDTWPAGLQCSVDIEGGLPNWDANDKVRKDSKKRRHLGWKCVSISGTPSKGFGIGFWKFNEDDHIKLILSFAKLMGRQDVPKVLQNCLYDIFVTGYGYKIHIANMVEDTMLKSWEIYAELPRALHVQASIWTREPHWKDDDMYEGTGDGLLTGCCKDTTVTLEISQGQDAELMKDKLSRVHYDTTKLMASGPFLYMQYRGMKYDSANARLMSVDNQKQINEVRERLARQAGYDLCGAKGSLSNKKLCQLLYEDEKYPPQYAKENGRLTTKLTTDVEALLSLKRHREGDTLLDNILKHRHLEGVLETLDIATDADGRVRCRYNLDAETGRVKCYTSPTGAGANLQTIQSKLRVNYLCDPDYEMAQYDLEGADGWTVAAHLKAIGAPQLIEDYRAGMKPAKILALHYRFGPDIDLLDQDSLKWAHDKLFPLIKDEYPWLYLGCKRVQHGGCYMMGIPTMQWNVLHDSFKESGKPEYMLAPDARVLLNVLYRRYQINLWHKKSESLMLSTGELRSASGHNRMFFGRRFGREAHDTLKEWLAHEPQSNTTWATNLCVLNLWNDPANRRFDGSLIIEPLHQVHDALLVQWPIVLRDWAMKKMRLWSKNELLIANVPITIPFDGKRGSNWGTLKDAA